MFTSATNISIISH